LTAVSAAGRSAEAVKEAALIDIGHGTVLAGRYRLEQRRGRSESAASWWGTDRVLDRGVEVLVVEAGSPHATDVLDAGRRAALVDDSRLARVLDVGTDPNGGVFVVTDMVTGIDLADLAGGRPMPVDLARALVGEAALALDYAARRGLHHLAISPRHVALLDDGGVLVRGVAVDAAAAGRRVTADASREDVVGLTRLLVGCLTGFGTEALDDVPPPLNALCTAVLTQDAGPQTPADLATALAPWPSRTRLGKPRVPSKTASPTATLSAALEPPPPPRAVHPAIQPQGPFGTVWEPATSDEPLGRLGPEVPLARPPEEQTRVVLAIVGIALVLVLAVAAFGVRGLGKSASSLFSAVDPRTQTSAPADLSGQPAPSVSLPEATPSPATAPPAISGIRPIDPQGDGEENDDRAPRAIDSDESTAWTSARYKSAQFGNLKQGLGLVLELEQSATITEVVVDVAGSGGTAELRQTTQQDDVEGTTVIATGQIENDQVVLRPAAPVVADRLLVWFTRLPNDAGQFRLEVSEVSLR
jgi:hypothetical protein